MSEQALGSKFEMKSLQLIFVSRKTSFLKKRNNIANWISYVQEQIEIIYKSITTNI
jgi:hypothetical protein